MKSYSYKVVCFGEVLWDLLPTGAKPGGAPMNVAYHLEKLGMHTALISRVGNDERGVKLLDVLKKNGLETSFIQQDEKQPTGVVIATPGKANEVVYEIVEPVAWDFIECESDQLSIVKEADYFIHGSLAARSPQSYKTLMQLREEAKNKIVDINLRPPHFQPIVIEELLKGINILKLNEHELPLLTSWYNKLSTEEEQLLFLQDRFCIPTIVITKGGNGATVCINGSITKHQGYKVSIADTVGSGDAFLAAFIFKTMKGDTIMNALAYANATGALVASKEGACPSYSIDEISKLIE